MSIVATEDMNYLAQQTPGELNMILAGMTALMNDIENKASAMESQNWFQRMAKTITGKNKLTLAEIQQNYEKLNSYMSEAIAELYNRNCIDHKVMVSLGVQINELYADHIQLKQMLGAFVSKLNEKIDSVDNFHMLITEIDHGVYSSADPIVAICKVMSQFDNRILEDDRKLDIISRSLHAQGILNGDQIRLTSYLANILDMSMDDMGQIHLELGTIRGNFLASVMLGVMENYYFLPDLDRKMKRKSSLIEEIIQTKELNDSISLSTDEIYKAFLDSKIDEKNGLISIGEVAPVHEEKEITNSAEDIKTTQFGIESSENENAIEIELNSLINVDGYTDGKNGYLLVSVNDYVFVAHLKKQQYPFEISKTAVKPMMAIAQIENQRAQAMLRKYTDSKTPVDKIIVVNSKFLHWRNPKSWRRISLEYASTHTNQIKGIVILDRETVTRFARCLDLDRALSSAILSLDSLDDLS